MAIVSAIITTRNRLLLLQRAINSVKAQTYPDIELIVVDDNSTDGTEQFCLQQQLKYIRVGENEGHGGNHARNLGIMAAHGKYVAFLDDDDYWKPEKTVKQVKLLEERGCDVVYCGRTNEIIKDGETSYTDELPDKNNGGDLSTRIMYIVPAVTSTMLFRRDALLATGMFDENIDYWQEYELSIRLAQRSPFFFVNEALVVYRINIGDKKRKTNNYYRWKEAVKYVRRKHSDKYCRLDAKQHVLVRLLVNGDGRQRCKASGMHLMSFALHLKGMYLRRLLRSLR